MSFYGDNLRKYIKENGMSVRKLSIETEIHRTLLQKYLSGERLPKNMEEVRHISRCLMLSPAKQDNLTECYNRSRYGEKRYEGFLMIQDMLKGLTDFRMHPVMLQKEGSRSEKGGIEKKESSGRTGKMGVEKEGNNDRMKESYACMGALEVESALRHILKKQSCIGKTWKLQLIAQPESGNLSRTILSVCAGQNVEVEQIICLDEETAEGNQNIKIVYNLLPMLFGSIRYQSLFYYDKKDAHINSMSLLPVLVLAGDSAMICNSKMDEALVFCNTESVNFCRRQYQQMKQRTSLLTPCFRDDVTEWMTFLQNFMTDLAVAEICIGSIPCVTYSLDESILKEILCLGEEGNQCLMDIFAKNRETFLQASDKKAPVNIFEESGLRRFMETGRSDEYPDDWYTPISPSNRLRMLEAMIAMAENRYMDYVMVNPENLPLDPNLLIYVNENVVFQYHQDNQLSQYFSVNERGVRQSFQEFIGFAQENGWLYDTAATIRRMKEILAEYREKFEIM